LVDELQAAIAPPGRRMGPWLAGVGLGALVLGGSLVWWQADTALVEPCVVDSQALQGTWDPERRAALRRTNLSSSPGYAEPTWRALEEGLDTWADHWLQARRSACLATRVEGTQSEASLDLRMACLDRAARSLAITLDTVTASEEGASLPARAPALLERLPVLAACDDPRPLAQVEARPEGEAVEAIYEGISRARAQASMGQLDRARASVEALEQRWPLAARYAPVRIELAALPSQLDIEDGRREAAVQRLVELSREAQARHLDDLAAQLRVEAAGAAAGYLRSARLERFVVDEAAAALERLGRPSDRRWAAVRHAEANLALKSARLEEALEGFGRARELATEGGDHARAEQERWHIAATLARLGRLDEARALLVEGRDLAEQRWGEGAPLVGHFEFDLSVLEQEAGRFEEAAAHLQRAQTIYEAAFGVESFPVARTHYAEAKLRMVQGDLGGARARIDEALVVYLRELSPEHEGLVDLHEARGVLRFFQGDLEGSIADYEAALRIGAAVLPADDPTLGRLHSNRGESEAALGDIDAARRSFDRALEIYARGLPPDHVDWALPLKGRGQAALAQGRIEPAIVDLERGLQLQQRSGEEPLELADLRASLARAYLSRGGRSDDAMALAQRAREDFAAVGMDERVEELDQWLAEIARSRRSPASEP
ncbi:MAG: tetratricopeptide repeat protein, partial [Nannocystaceae bacterium]